jgi:hypothetical protein
MMPMNREQVFLDLPTGSRRYGRLAACGTRQGFMGSVHGLSSVHNAHEPRVLPADCKSALRGGGMGSAGYGWVK